MEIDKEMKEIVMVLSKINGVRPRMARYYDEEEKSLIDFVIMDNKFEYGKMTYATVGLCNYDIGYTVQNKSLRIEMIGVCAEECDFFPNILATCAFNIINSGYSCYPGAIFPDVIKMYNNNLEMQHILFVSPFLWDDELQTLHFHYMEVAWLQAIPISEAEYQYAEKYGSEALEDLLEKAGKNILDIDRKSVI